MESFITACLLCNTTVRLTSENDTMTNITLSTNDTLTDGTFQVPICLQDPSVEAFNEAIEAGQVNYTTIINGEDHKETFKSCPKFRLSSDMLCAVDSTTILVPAYGREYSNMEYYIYEGLVSICAPSYLFDEKEEHLTERSPDVTAYLTITGISISNVCLALHILAFLLIPEMHNLPGSNLAALAVTVFFSNLFFAVAQRAVGYNVACITLSSFALFFFLSSFLWMNVIGFETWRSLRMASNELRLCTKLMEQKRYIHYSLYAWLTPLFIVTIALIVDNAKGVNVSVQPKLGKGEKSCWISEQGGLIIFFVVPLIIVMVLNLIFFLWSAFVIHKHTDRLNRDKKFHSLLQKFSSYGKLAVITGLTWLSGILAFAVKHVATLYIFIIFTAFYGFFIFASFTCTKKVFSHLKKRFPFIKKWIPIHSNYTTSSKSDTHDSNV